MEQWLLDIAEEALREAHGQCEEHKPERFHEISKCPQHGDAWLTVWRAKHMGVTPEQWAASKVAPPHAAAPERRHSPAEAAIYGPACLHCGSRVPIVNDLGDKRCSGCGRDWVSPAPIAGTPSTMLGEALALLQRVQDLGLAAHAAMPETLRSTVYLRVQIQDVRTAMEGLKAEAETREPKP